MRKKPPKHEPTPTPSGRAPKWSTAKVWREGDPVPTTPQGNPRNFETHPIGYPLATPIDLKERKSEAEPALVAVPPPPPEVVADTWAKFEEETGKLPKPERKFDADGRELDAQGRRLDVPTEKP